MKLPGVLVISSVLLLAGHFVSASPVIWNSSNSDTKSAVVTQMQQSLPYLDFLAGTEPDLFCYGIAGSGAAQDVQLIVSYINVGIGTTLINDTQSITNPAKQSYCFATTSPQFIPTTASSILITMNFSTGGYVYGNNTQTNSFNICSPADCGGLTGWFTTVFGLASTTVDSFDLLTHVFSIQATSTTNRRIGEDNPECSPPSSIFEILSTKGLIYVFCTVFMPRQSDVSELAGLDEYLLTKSPFYYITDTITLKDELFQNTSTSSQITFDFNAVVGNSILNGSTTALDVKFMPNSLSSSNAVSWFRSLITFMLWAVTIYVLFIFAINIIQ